MRDARVHRRLDLGLREIEFRQRQRRLRLADAGLGALQHGLGAIRLLLRGGVLLEQRLGARELLARVFQRRLRRGEARFGRGDARGVVAVVEAGDHLARLDDRAFDDVRAVFERRGDQAPRHFRREVDDGRGLDRAGLHDDFRDRRPHGFHGPHEKNTVRDLPGGLLRRRRRDREGRHHRHYCCFHACLLLKILSCRFISPRRRPRRGPGSRALHWRPRRPGGPAPRPVRSRPWRSAARAAPCRGRGRLCSTCPWPS